MDAPVVVVGGGLAGYQSVKEIRRMDKTVPILLVSSDAAQFYSKPMLSNALAANKTPDSLVLKSAEQMAQELGIEILAHARVDALFPGNREIGIGGERIGYSKLVLALGADPIRLPIEGEILSVNDLSDYGKFRQAIAGKKRVSILGAGLIGCEFADDLLQAGFAVDVFDIADQPLGRLVPPECGLWIRHKLAVNWHFGAKVAKIEKDGVILEGGDSVRTDVVLSAVGLKPRTSLALHAGIEVGRGIRVDRHLETSAEDVYAIGDCMEIEGLVLPFVMPIMHASRVLAANLLGERVRLSYPPMPVVVKTPSCPTVVSPPPAGSIGTWNTVEKADGVRSVFVGEEGKLLGFCLCGEAVSEKAQLAKELPSILP